MSAYEEISELLHQVPRPPEDPIPSGVSSVEISKFEERTGITVPTTLRSWLELTNGPCVGPGGFYGINTLRPHLEIEEYLGKFPEWMKKKWLPIAGDGCGNFYIVPTQNEFGVGYPVIFIDVGQSASFPSYVIASDLEHFILATLRKELGSQGWPFGQNQVLAFDPCIKEFHSVSLPWENKWL